MSGDPNPDILADLAGAAHLSEALLTDIWVKGSELARRRIARRRNLPGRIEADILAGGDSDLLCEWLRTQRPGAALAQVDPDISNSVRIHLAWQPELSAPQRRAIASHKEPKVLTLLAGRGDLTADEREDIITYHLLADPAGRLPDGIDIHKLPRTSAFWEPIATQADVEQSDILAEALIHVDDPAVHQIIGRNARRLADRQAHQHNGSSGKLLRLLRLLVSSPHIPADTYAELVDHPLLSEIRSQLRKRLDIDLERLATPLAHCDPIEGCTVVEHLAALQDLIDAGDVVRLTGDRLLRAAVAHRHHLTDRSLAAIVCRADLTPALEPLVEELVAHQRWDSAAVVVRSGDRRLLGLLARHRELIRTLARQGWTPVCEISNRISDIDDIANHYTPARELVGDPYLGSRIAETLSALDETTRDTVYRLLAEWVGDFPSVIDAAKTL